MNNSLTVYFDIEDNAIIYEGQSYLKRNLSDRIIICKNKISILFTRSKKVDSETILTTPNSLLRYELQKALCFYLVSQKNIPEVSLVEFSDGYNKKPMKDCAFTSTWRNCEISVGLDADLASIIFSNKSYAKDVYIIITYFIKAQLDRFSNDRFRAAWTGINAVYRMYRKNEKERESDQINKLRNRIKVLPMKKSVHAVESLGDQFWGGIEWYILAVHCDYKHIFDSNYNSDYLIMMKMISLFNDEKKRQEIVSYEKRIKTIIKQKKVDYYSRLAFLVCDYCYMLRNRYFHAAKAYPVFIIAEDIENYHEKRLTELLLFVIVDLFDDIVNPSLKLMEKGE